MTRIREILDAFDVMGDARATGRSDAVDACLGIIGVDVAYVRAGIKFDSWATWARRLRAEATIWWGSALTPLAFEPLPPFEDDVIISRYNYSVPISSLAVTYVVDI